MLEAASSKTVSKKSPARGKTPGLWRTSECQNHAKKVPNVSSEILEKARFLVGCWLLAVGCYWRWLLATGYVHLLRALAHVLDTHWCYINEKTAKRHVWNPIEIYTRYIEVPNVSSWHPRKTQFFDRFCCWRLLAVKQVRKNHLPGGKTPGLWRTSECQNHAKKVPNVSSEILEKSRDLVGCWLLAAGCYWRWLLATGYVHLLRALAHVLDTHWCHPRKTQFFVLLAAALLPLRLLLLRLLGKTQFFDRFCCWRLLAVKQVRKNHLPRGKTPGLWRTSECQNHAKKVPNVSSEILEKSRDFW